MAACVPTTISTDSTFRLYEPLRRITFIICPTGPYCREDRCQSFFKFELIPSVRAPLEECEAAGAIRDAGGIATIVDAQTEGLSPGELFSRIGISQPEAVVLVVTFGTLEDDLLWAERVKLKFPALIIGLRGAPCYVLEKDIFERSPSIDFCVKGEYESIFKGLATRGIAETKGVSFRNGANVLLHDAGLLEHDLDVLPLPDRSSINHSLYRVRGFGEIQATIRVQRGCPFPCSYCLVHTVSGSRARHRSPGHITQEIAALMEQGFRSFYFRAETFTLDREWALSVCSELKKECPGIRWVTTTRVDRVDQVLIQAMADAGCYGISFGVDVASKSIGKKVNKLADARATQNALTACDKSGVISLVYLMVGFVWESRETLAEVAEFLRSIRPDLLTIHYAHPYPGTRYYQDAIESGLVVVSKKAQAEPASSVAGLSSKEIEKFAQARLLRHYLRIPVVMSIARKVFRRWFIKLKRK